MAAATETDCLASIFAAIDQAGPAPDGFPTVDEALARLAEIPGHADLADARRVALAGLAQTQLDYGPDGARSELVARALAGLSSHDPGLEALAPVLPVHTVGTLSRRIVAPGDVDAVTRLHSELGPIAGLSLDDVKPVLNPVNWHRCFRKWWTGMTRQDEGGNRWHYLEEVAGWSQSLRVSVCLEFFQSEGPGRVAMLQFMKCNVADHQPPDCRVVLDTGFVLARQDDDGVLLTTSKTIQFADPFNDGAWLSAFAPGLGYGEIAGELVNSCITCRDADRSWEPVEVVDG
jgi:hypothetical protein